MCTVCSMSTCIRMSVYSFFGLQCCYAAGWPPGNEPGQSQGVWGEEHGPSGNVSLSCSRDALIDSFLKSRIPREWKESCPLPVVVLQFWETLNPKPYAFEVLRSQV